MVARKRAGRGGKAGKQGRGEGVSKGNRREQSVSG